MRIDGDWEDGASVEDWVASVEFDGVRKDTTGRWRRSLVTILKYARRIPCGVLRLRICYGLEFVVLQG